MTILPKKKHQELRKSDQDQENNDTRNRTRNRSSRDTRSRTQQNSVDESVSETSSGTLSSPIYNDLDTRDSHESVGLPHKRSRGHTRGGGSSRDGNSPCNDDENEDGYNSSDEHGPRNFGPKGYTLEMLNEREAEFERQLAEKKGFVIKQMATDGACLFRAVADQVYGDQEMHSVVRRHCMDYMVKNRDFFSQYITEDFSSYIRRKRNEHAHGNHTEMQALSEMYNRPIEVYQYSYEPINTFHSRSYSNEDNAPIRLSYHGNVHYNSVTDPYNPTVGVGLGLAGYKPGFDNKEILRKTMNESEATLLEQEMLKDKLKATDWEATDEHLAELAARESYLQWLKDSQKASSAGGASSSTSTSTQSRRSPLHESSHFNKSPLREHAHSRRSPSHDQATSHKSPHEGTRKSPPRDVKRSPPRDTYGSSNHSGAKQSKGDSSQSSAENNRLVRSDGACASLNDWSVGMGYDSDWDNDPLLAAVLAQSQQEYLESMCNNSTKRTEDSQKSQNCS